MAIAKGQDTAVGKGADGDVDGGRDSEQFPDDAVGERRASKSRSWFEKCVPVFSRCVFVCACCSC